MTEEGRHSILPLAISRASDIHDRKRAEEELKRAHDDFADTQQLSKTGRDRS